jgi:hypothetical protein
MTFAHAVIYKYMYINLDIFMYIYMGKTYRYKIK